ncbi:hypothetical protein PENSPDRAFT_662244 [Peniophora sp. CONT]|nr:hypothetical protein PENSPDRAFT_662244 [Peniophora sp. CONT]
MPDPVHRWVGALEDDVPRIAVTCNIVVEHVILSTCLRRHLAGHVHCWNYGSQKLCGNEVLPNKCHCHRSGGEDYDSMNAGESLDSVVSKSVTGLPGSSTKEANRMIYASIPLLARDEGSTKVLRVHLVALDVCGDTPARHGLQCETQPSGLRAEAGAGVFVVVPRRPRHFGTCTGSKRCGGRKTRPVRKVV